MLEYGTYLEYATHTHMRLGLFAKNKKQSSSASYYSNGEYLQANVAGYTPLPSSKILSHF